MKRCRLIPLFLLVLSLFTACGGKEANYSFPLSREDLEAALKKYNMQWKLEDEQSFDEFHAVYSFRNDDDVFCSVESRGGENEERRLSIRFVLPYEFEQEQATQYLKNEIGSVFDLAGSLYGNGITVKRAKTEFSGFIKSKENFSDEGLHWQKRLKDTFFMLAASTWDDKAQASIRTCSLVVMNRPAYEQSILSNARLLKSPDQNEPVYEPGTIAGVRDSMQETEDQKRLTAGFIIKGRLLDIAQRENMPESFVIGENDYLLPDQKGYLSAELADDTGSIEVFIKPTLLSFEELSREREHFILVFYTEEPFAVILFSPEAAG
jgi:hypothetical protein